MNQNKIKILSTRPFDTIITDGLGKTGIEIDMMSFIDTEPIQSVEVQQEIEQALLQETTVVFTSMNAVEAVAAHLDGNQPEWSIYCLGSTTQELVKNYFGFSSVSGTANSAEALANLIIEDGYSEEVIFFCGDQRRDELPEILSAGGIDVTEIMVYHTIAIPHKIEKDYDGILFFSPSAADSFFSVNTIPRKTTLFAIGKTTAATLKKYSSNRIITGDKPGKQYLLDKALHHFAKGKS